MAEPVRLWLDDERDPTDSRIQQLFGARGDELWVQTVPDAIAVLSDCSRTVLSVSLDNDLGIDGTENEGFRVAQWIEERAATGTAPPPNELKVHSANPVRSAEMHTAFANAKRYAARHWPDVDKPQ